MSDLIGIILFVLWIGFLVFVPKTEVKDALVYTIAGLAVGFFIGYTFLGK